jgi:membrane dipeptidase
VIADLHLDMPLDLADRQVAGETDVFMRRHLPELRGGGVEVQVLPTFIDDQYLPDGALRAAVRQIEAVRRAERESGGAFAVVGSRAELEAARGRGALAGILAMEGAEALGREPELVHIFHQLGVRMIGLTWNRSNEFADGLAEDRGVGITPMGERLLREMAGLGIALDLSHLTPRGCARALEVFDGPVLASHANAFAVHPNPRNLADDLLAEIGRRGGVVGLVGVAAFVGSPRIAESLADHYERIVEVAGAQAPAFGADFCDFLLGGPGTPIVQEDATSDDLDLANLPQLPRQTFYRDVLSEVERRSGPEACPPLAEGNAMRFLTELLP